MVYLVLLNKLLINIILRQLENRSIKKESKALRILSVKRQILICSTHHTIIYSGKHNGSTMSNIFGYSAARNDIKKLLKSQESNNNDSLT